MPNRTGWYKLHDGVFTNRQEAERMARAHEVFRKEMGYVSGTRVRRVRGGYVIESKLMRPPKGAVWQDGKWVR